MRRLLPEPAQEVTPLEAYADGPSAAGRPATTAAS